jgi:hypothetical protein
MIELTIEDVFYRRTEAEQKLHSLGLRKNKQLQKNIKSVRFCYWIMEGFDIAKIWQIESDLKMEQWILEDLIKRNKCYD